MTNKELDRFEDEILNEIAEERNKSFNRDEELTHKEVWVKEEKNDF